MFEVLEEDDALATEATGEEDEDGSGLKRWSVFRWADSFADL